MSDFNCSIRENVRRTEKFIPEGKYLSHGKSQKVFIPGLLKYKITGNPCEAVRAGKT
jgi:hypothetical protein